MSRRLSAFIDRMENSTVQALERQRDHLIRENRRLKDELVEAKKRTDGLWEIAEDATDYIPVTADWWDRAAGILDAEVRVRGTAATAAASPAAPSGLSLSSGKASGKTTEAK